MMGRVEILSLSGIKMDISVAQLIKGWMELPELLWLAERAQESRIIIEYGCYHGRSTRALADNTSGKVYAVDPWDGKYYLDNGSLADFHTDCYEHFLKNLEQHIKTGKVIPVREFSWAFKPPELADLIFIDGDHRYESVIDDIKCAFRYIKPGGIVAGHDYGRADWPGVRKAVDEMFPEIEQIDTIWSVRL